MDCGKNQGKLFGVHSNNHLYRYFTYILILNQEILCKALWQLGHHTLILEQCDFHASESRANFWIYIGNQQHPKLSTRTYGCSHVF